MMVTALLGAFMLFGPDGASATEAPRARLQAVAPGIGYDEFMRLSPDQRRARFDVIGAENRAIIVQTHARRWLHDNRGRLTAEEVTVFEEIIAYLEPGLHRGRPDEASKKRDEALMERMRCRVGPEDVKRATDVFGNAGESPHLKMKWNYLSKGKCWIEWLIEGVADYVATSDGART